jgi:hypothetical protein
MFLLPLGTYSSPKGFYQQGRPCTIFFWHVLVVPDGSGSISGKEGGIEAAGREKAADFSSTVDDV